MSRGGLFDEVQLNMEDNDYDVNYVRCVLFRLDSEAYGVNVQRVREVLRVGEIRPVPGSPSNVLGVINVRGVIVTILDTRSFFKLYSADITDFSRIIIIEEGDQVLGLLVDEVKEVRDISEDRIDPVGTIGEDNNNRLIQGVAHVPDEGVVIIIDPERFFEGSSLASSHAVSGGGDDDLF